MTQLQALIFDVDGTLAETERDGHRCAFNQAFADFGLDWDWSVELYGQLLEVSGGRERIRHYINHYLERPLPKRPDLPDVESFCHSLHQAKTARFEQFLQMGTLPLRPGVRRLIGAAQRAKVRLAIATTSAPASVYTLLQTTLAPNAADWFEVIAAGDMVPTKKPAPDVYLYALNKLGLLPEHCLAIEDSNQGLTAATRAGLKTVVTVNDYTRSQDFSAAALVLDHLGDPERPFQVLMGKVPHAAYFTLGLAEYLLGGKVSPQPTP